MSDGDLTVARHLADEAGEILRAHFEGVLRVRHKGAVDLVTQADLRSEARIREILDRLRPGDAILGEEEGVSGEGARRWIIDPLDGTTNFVHGLPHFCISIALEVEGEVVVGLVDQPITGERFEAVAGQGAQVNGRPLAVSEEGSLSECLMGTGFPTDRRERIGRYLPFAEAALVSGQGLRRAGAAALDLAYVAAGRLDAFWEFSLKPWDIAAGALLVKEAGGRCTDLDGAPLALDAPVIVASNGRVHDAFLGMLQGAAPRAGVRLG